MINVKDLSIDQFKLIISNSDQQLKFTVVCSGYDPDSELPFFRLVIRQQHLVIESLPIFNLYDKQITDLLCDFAEHNNNCDDLPF